MSPARKMSEIYAEERDKGIEVIRIHLFNQSPLAFRREYSRHDRFADVIPDEEFDSIVRGIRNMGANDILTFTYTKRYPKGHEPVECIYFPATIQRIELVYKGEFDDIAVDEDPDWER